MKGTKLMAMAVVGIMIASGFFMLVPSTAKANQYTGPTHIDLIAEPTNSVMVPTGWEKTVISEQSDFKISGNLYERWYRANDSANAKLGFATSTNGVAWTRNASNPISMGAWWAYPYVVTYHGCFYMFAGLYAGLYLYNITTSPISPQVMNGGKPVYYHNTLNTTWDYQIFNVGVAIVGNTWYMLVEGRLGGNFNIGFAESTFAELNWSAHRSTYYMFPKTGNPYLTYVPDRNALLAIYGNHSDTYWTVDAMYCYLTNNPYLNASWVKIPSDIFRISSTTHHIADPSMISDFSSTYGMMISYGYDQTKINQTYYAGSLVQMFDQMTVRAIITQQVAQLVYLIPFLTTLGVALLPVIYVAKLAKEKKTMQVNDVVKVATIIVVGLALIGVAYAMI
jgi:hypothetical protein